MKKRKGKKENSVVCTSLKQMSTNILRFQQVPFDPLLCARQYWEFTTKETNYGWVYIIFYTWLWFEKKNNKLFYIFVLFTFQLSSTHPKPLEKVIHENLGQVFIFQLQNIYIYIYIYIYLYIYIYIFWN